ncbi:MAG: zinc-dependent metalloprotease [Prosthecobacter sp.]|nr:zinc-dependent metalloprotease [Prosthecobacter sp.]
MDGVVQAGHNRGGYGNEVIFRISKIFERIEFIAENTSFYFDPQSALARAKQANISHAVLASEGIVAEDAGGYLIPASNLFLRESLAMVKRPGGDANRSVLGRLSETKTKFLSLRGYPDNTVVGVEYVFENPTPTWTQDNKARADEITDARYVSIKVQHSLIKLPENDFKPRYDDPRIGYFTTQVTDMTSTSATPWRDVIHRWHLVKQKPGTKLSEPVQPIVFWIENTTPIELRDTIREAALRWNEAFETAGFKDALVIKQQPDNATWDAGDINYNVLRWTSSPNPPFGGYGPSFVNPRTGQILGADIMLEFSFLTNRLRSQRIFMELGLASPQEETEDAFRDPRRFCQEAGFAQQGLLFGQAALRLSPEGRLPDMKALTRQALMKLILHELGHTLGLNHNFRASHLYDATQIHNQELTSKTGLTGSVMDYMPANIAPLNTPQGDFYITKPGPYDHWAIEYGYSEALEDPKAEEARLQAIAALSPEPALAFGNDADDMRRVGKGIDPRVMIYDMSSDPVTYGTQRCQLVQARLGELLTKVPVKGESWQPLLQAYLVLTREQADALVAISRYVGGVEVERAFVGQGSDKKPYTPVAAARQFAALDAMAKFAFAPGAMQPPTELAAHLQQQRRGFDFFKEDEAPKLHDRIGQVQRALLDHLMHLETQRRILDSGLYGNAVSLDQIMRKLTQAIFLGDPAEGPDTVRQNLQSEYTDRLLRIVNSSSWPPAAQSPAFAELEFIRTQLETLPAFRTAAAHTRFLIYKIKRGLDEQR